MRTIALVLSAAAIAWGGVDVKRVAWQDTPTAFLDKTVLIELSSGAKIEGRWIGIADGRFTMQVEKTSNSRAIGRGTQTLERSAIPRLATRHRRVRGRVIGTVVGFYAIAGMAVLATRSPDGLQSGWGVAAYGAGIGGFFAGRAWDRTTEEVELTP